MSDQETPAYRICGECDGRNPVESRDHALNRCMYCGNTEIMSGRFVPKAAPAQPVLAESAPPVHKPLTLVELHQKHRIMVPPSGGTIGRHGDLDPQFFARCPHVSGTHCRLYVTQGEWYVRDLGSMNHTYINGNKLGTEATKLTAKSILQIADVKFDIEII